MKHLILCLLTAGTALAAEPHWTEVMKTTSLDDKGVKQDFYEYIDDSSLQRAGTMVSANVRTVTQTTYPSGVWLDSVSVTKTGFNCTRRIAGPLQRPLSARVIQHNADGTLADVTAIATAQSPPVQLGLTRPVGPDDKDFAYACSHR